MAKFLTTLGSQAEIENIIDNARNRLVVISPYIRIQETLLQSLKAADRRSVKIVLVYGKDELKPETKSQLEQLSNLSLYFLENLHAKCFFNEESMVITSLNLYESAEGNNREMGVLISRKEDEDCFKDAVKEASVIVSSAAKVELGKPKVRTQSKTKRSTSGGTGGYCIRCKTLIPLNPDQPLCRDCYDEWAEWENPDYEEKFCHTCGKPTPTTIEKPLCHHCYAVLFG